MIRAIELENFKGIGARTRIDLASVTLLFGANNVGKSTILQSLIFVYEVIKHGSADVDRTELGQESLDLGGFARIVHGHALTEPPRDAAEAEVVPRSIRLRVEFDTTSSLNRLGRNLEAFSFPDLDDGITTAWLELRAAHRQGWALIESVTIGSGDEPLVWIELGRTLREGEPLLAQINLGHPVLGDRGRELGSLWEESALDVSGRGFGDGSGLGMGMGGLLVGGGYGDGRAVPIFAIRRTRRSALPPLDEPIRLVAPEFESPGSMSGSRSGSSSALRSRSGSDTDESLTERAMIEGEVQAFLELVVLGICGQLHDALRDALYIGPLRAVPSRGFLLERSGGRFSRWADGLAAWETLLNADPWLVGKTNEWLTRLGVGCKINVQHLVDEEADAEDMARRRVDFSARRLLLASASGALVLPSELGAGVSQLVPVVVAMLLPHHRGLVMVEQPEIHVHPALQVELGDLLIESAAQRQIIIETHSEHLILRLLRRIRETHDGELPAGAPAFHPEKLAVLYVESEAEGARVRRLEVQASGEFTDRWPKGFFEERSEELF
jgi:hypothetical protein